MAEIDPLGSPEPTYLQIANALQARIAAGEFPVRLPGERALADHYDVAYQTLRHAIDILRQRDQVATRHGRGSFTKPPAPPAPRLNESQPMPPPAADAHGQVTMLQLMDDAITYRRSRLAQPCPGCAPARRCPEHAPDEHLITQYRDRYDQALRGLLTGIDPADIARHIPASGDTLPTGESAGLLYREALARPRQPADTPPPSPPGRPARPSPKTRPDRVPGFLMLPVPGGARAARQRPPLRSRAVPFDCTKTANDCVPPPSGVRT